MVVVVVPGADAAAAAGVDVAFGALRPAVLSLQDYGILESLMLGRKREREESALTVGIE